MSVFLRRWETKTGEKRHAYRIQLDVRRPDGSVEKIRRHSQASTKAGAIREEQLLVQAALTGTLDKLAGVPSLSTVADEFLRTKKGTIKDSTHDWYTAALKVHILPAIGRRRVTEVKGEVIDELRASLSKGRKPGTVAGHLRALKATLRFAVDAGHLDKLPKIVMPKRSDEVPELKALTHEEADALVAAASVDAYWHALVVVALRTGLRAGELAALEWRDVDLDGRRLHVRRSRYNGITTSPKGNREREVPLSSQAVVALKTQRERDPKGVLVFPRGKHTHSKDTLAIGLRRFGTARPHDLRHTFGAHAVAAGVPLRQLQEWMGHRSIQTTEVYSAWLPRHGESLVERLDRGAGHSSPESGR
ncbi:MAG: tyrosine-type recombinase/integrase [Myxococcaceae bacterium]